MRPKRKNFHSLFADYFIFPRYQRRAVVVLTTLCIISIFGPMLYLYFHEAEKSIANNLVVRTENRLKARQLQEEAANENRNYAVTKAPNSATTTKQLFYFDPNKTSVEQWQQLGLRDKTIQTIQNYLAKAGRFRNAEDLRKIYGIRPADADRLIPFVRIQIAENDIAFKEINKNRTSTPERRELNRQPVEINAADTTDFISLPGIGSKLAGRIVNYREKLGGFYSVDQVGETYGLPDSTFQHIKSRLVVNTSLIKKIHLNTASAEELKTALIRYNVANAIVQYRNKNGAFSSLEGLRNIPIIDDYLYQRIIHYLLLD